MLRLALRDKERMSQLKELDLVYDLVSFLHDGKRMAINVRPHGHMHDDKITWDAPRIRRREEKMERCGTPFVLAVKSGTKLIPVDLDNRRDGRKFLNCPRISAELLLNGKESLCSIGKIYRVLRKNEKSRIVGYGIPVTPAAVGMARRNSGEQVGLQFAYEEDAEVMCGAVRYHKWRVLFMQNQNPYMYRENRLRRTFSFDVVAINHPKPGNASPGHSEIGDESEEEKRLALNVKPIPKSQERHRPNHRSKTEVTKVKVNKEQNRNVTNAKPRDSCPENSEFRDISEEEKRFPLSPPSTGKHSTNLRSREEEETQK